VRIRLGCGGQKNKQDFWVNSLEYLGGAVLADEVRATVGRVRSGAPSGADGAHAAKSALQQNDAQPPSTPNGDPPRLGCRRNIADSAP
jgi:hypothetical protein